MEGMSILSRVLSSVGIIFFLCGFVQADDRVAVSIDKREVTTGELFTYKIKIEGSFSSPEIKVPKFKDFKVASQRQSKSYAFEKGKAVVVASFTYQLFASEPGTFTIKEVVVADGDEEIKGESVTIEVIGKPLKERRKILPHIEQGIEI